MKDIIRTAGVLVFLNNKVLLVRHGEKAQHMNDVYGLPAGRIAEKETSIEAAVRELFEETGLMTAVEKLTKIPKVYTAAIERKDGTIKNFSQDTFLCHSWKGKLKTTEETIPEWINIDDLNRLKLLPNVQNMIFDGLKLKQNKDIHN